MKLAYTSYETPAKKSTDHAETATPIIIQHGLLGSRKNWASLSKMIHKQTGRKVEYILLIACICLCDFMYHHKYYQLLNV